MAWNRPNSRELVSQPLQKRKGFRFSFRSAIAGAIVVVGVAIAAWWIWSNATPHPSNLTSTSPSLIREVKPAMAKRGGTPRPRKAEKPTSDETRSGASVASAAVGTGDVAKVKIMTSFVVPSGKSTAIFTNAVLSQLQTYAIPSVDMPPPDPVDDADAIMAMRVGVEFSEDDDERTRAIKVAVREMLEQLDMWMRQGKSADSFFRELAHRQEVEGETADFVREQVDAALEKGDAEDAREQLQTYNRHLTSLGLPVVSVKGLPNEESDDEQKELE